MHNLAVDSSHEVSENTDNANDSGDEETPLTVIDEILPISRPNGARGALSRMTTA